MTFKVGDKVRYKKLDGYEDWHGLEGVVQSSDDDETRVVASNKVNAYTSVGGVARLTTENLELITATFTYEDIQVGDRIRRTLTRPSGTTEVREGTVAEKAGGLATDKGTLSYILAYDTDDHPDKHQVVLELLDRPKPKHWTETKPVGSVGVILDAFHTKILTKTSEHGWNVLYPSDGYTYKDTNKALERRSAQWDESKLTWIK